MLARRCRFLLAVWLVVPAAATLPLSAQENVSAPVLLPDAFPSDRYTPHGYLDNPFHSLVYNRSGVIRSFPPLGFGWWRTDFHAGGYALGDKDHVNYISLLRMGLTIDGVPFLTTADFAAQHVELSSAYHSKSVMSFDWEFRGVTVRLLFFLAAEHALVCVAELHNTGTDPKTVGLVGLHQYLIGATRWWGSDGLTARADPDPGIVVSKIWAYGDVFALGASALPQRFCTTAAQDTVERWMRDPAHTGESSASVQGRGPLFAALNVAITLPPRSRRTETFCLARGKNEPQARRTLQHILPSAIDSLRKQLEDDGHFWRACPVLTGDWPGAWKRGWVYDFETIRMTVRPPLGIFHHPWDGMQIHAPRLVLGETALDMLTLNYADPELARRVVEGTFADALAPNVPCAREDGSVNMISADGSECGTAPMWGYPFKTVAALHAMSADTAWLRRIYPPLKAYALWWLEHRTDAEGWLHCNNSWESGQDGSRRFLVAEDNEGAVADFVRTVDVEASMAEALRVLERSALILGLPADAERWKALSGRRVANTRAMFFDDRYYDVDGRNGRPIRHEGYYDIMMLAPLTCGVATPSHIAAIRPVIRRFATDPIPALQWPPSLATYVDAAWNANERQSAADLVAATADRVYSRTDAREIVPGKDAYAYRVPGVANEYWPVRDVPPGGEHYGWGATLPMFIIRTIAGFREMEDPSASAFLLAPTIPLRFMSAKREYTIARLHFRSLTFSLTMQADGPSRVSTRLAYSSGEPVVLKIVRRASGQNLVESTRQEITTSPLQRAGSVDFRGANGDVYEVHVSER